MKGSVFHHLRMTATLAVARTGRVAAMAGGIGAIAIAGWVWAIPAAEQQLEAASIRLSKAQSAVQAADSEPPAPARAGDQDRLAAFYAWLGEQGYAEQQLKTLFAAAARSGLVLHQGEYRYGIDKDGGFATYQAVLPLKGSYQAIRQFCERILLAVPFASLDDIGFKRESIGTANLEARVRLTIYLGKAGNPVEEEGKP